MKRLRTFASLALAAALLAVPAAGQAHHNPSHAKGGGKGPGGGKGVGTGKSCAKKPVVNKGFVLKGTLVSYTADDTATAGTNEASVTITVTGGNRHARRAGLTDADTSMAGLQYKLDHSADAFRLRLSGFGPGEAPSAGDRVRILGKVAVTRKKCAPGQSLADRYGDVDVRRVKVIDNTT